MKKAKEIESNKINNSLRSSRKKSDEDPIISEIVDYQMSNSTISTTVQSKKNMNLSTKIKENECLDKYRNKNSKLNKYMIGFKQKKPWYEIYLKESKIEKLPIIKNNNNSNNNIKEFNTPLKVKSSSNLKKKKKKK